MKYLYTISLCLIFSFFININITNAQTCGNTSCPSPKVCVSVDGATKCLDNQANSSGVCQGDSSIKCDSNQACVSNKDKEIVCATKVTANSLSPAPAKTSADAQTSAGGGSPSPKGNTSTSSTEAASTSSGTNPQGLKEGLNAFKGEDSGLNTTGTLIGFIANIIRWVLGILGTVFFVIVVMQGYLYMTAGGDSGKTASAVGAIGNAVIGLLIIMGAFLITNFVTSALLAS
jgi:hypothetical protein